MIALALICLAAIKAMSLGAQIRLQSESLSEATDTAQAPWGDETTISRHLNPHQGP